MRPGPATSTPRCCPSDERVPGPEHPDTLTARANLAHWTGAGGGCGRGPRPVRRAAARARAGPGPRAPRDPGRPRQPRPLDRAGGGCGRGPRPVRRAAAGPRAGPGPRAPGHPDRPRQPRPWTGQAGDAAGARDQYAALLPVESGSWAPSTRTPWPPAPTSPAGPGRRGMRPGPATSSPRCCRSASGCPAPSTRPP